MGMVIETKRLKIIVLTQEQLEMLVDNIPEFEKRLNCSYQGEKIEGIFKNILYEQSLKIEANSDVYLWLTFWLIVKKDDNIAVGMIDFKNIPNENREVEIGYGLGKKHEHFGYMTEAVEAFCTWGKKQASVKHIIAETEIDNFSSQRVLQRNGFIEYFRDKTIWCIWHISTAGFAEQNGRNAKLNGRITFDY